MILNGNNLGERHRDLNLQVSASVTKQTNFEDLKLQPEKCDVDKLFKIELASKYKNIDYILEVLKCGDIFYITRALKCLWLYTDEYCQFINTDYLETNIFPFMSMKMKRKMLTAISIHLRNPVRAIDFYSYCKVAKLNNYAVKFLIYTTDDFKLELLKTRNLRDMHVSQILQPFIGTSFKLALCYLALCDYSSSVIHELRYLYSVSDKEYLDIWEYIKINTSHPHCSQRLGIRISKDILKKHKQRVMNKPLLYINTLNKNKLIKHLAVEDVELLASGLLPETSEDFWSLDFYNTYKFILSKIHENKLFGFIKEMYTSKYKKREFEFRIEFYRLKYYELLNIDEREAWALQHIERDKDLPGIKNYMWYKFVSFPKAFSGIKRYIFLTPDKDERVNITNILPETARNQDDINEILNYYYGRHVNESEEDKESFINKLIELHDIFSFNNECWTSLDKLFYSLNVYTTASYIRSEYKFSSLIYYILHDKELLDALKEFVESLGQFYHFESIVNKLSEEKKVIGSKYLTGYFAEKIKTLTEHPDYNVVKDDTDEWDSGSIKSQIQDLVSKIWSILYCFKRPNEECPEIVNQFMEENMDFYQYHERYKVKFEKSSEGDFVRWLKEDVETAINGIYEIRCNTYRWNFRLCRLFKKLKVYFPNDVGKEYLDYFMEYLSDIPKSRREYRNIKMAVVGVFYLADPETIISLLEKHNPSSPKIDHMNTDHRILQLQKAICRLAYHPRPPLPLPIIKKYITGDYVHFCIPIFYNYFANLPSNEKFIESLLDAPLSIQKHGLRLAFKGYDAESLKPIIISAWRKTKNVSLRMILYETLFDRIVHENEEIQKQLYEVLKLYTSELNHDDHEKVYSLLVSDDLPDIFKGDFIETAWLTVSNLSDKHVNIQRRISIVCHMEKYIHLVQREFPRIQIINVHIKNMLFKKKINRDCGEYYLKELIKAKWNLTAKYIVSFRNKAQHQDSLQLLQTIMTKSLKSWNLVKYEKYTLRKFMQKFIKTIMNKDPKTVDSCADIILLYQCIRNSLKLSLKEEEMYLLNWELKLSIICRDIIHNGRKREIESDEPRYMSSKDLCKEYGKAVAEIIVKRLQNDDFNRCFYQAIADIVNDIGNTMCNILRAYHSGFVYYVCEGLIETKITETHLLALFMLPTDPAYNWESEHSEIISNIKAQSVSQEVRSFLYQKYMLADCKVRDYM